jgi:hypothetical protein
VDHDSGNGGERASGTDGAGVLGLAGDRTNRVLQQVDYGRISIDTGTSTNAAEMAAAERKGKIAGKKTAEAVVL